MRNAPALHGRDHCPGGADPIPCLGSRDWGSAEAEIGATENIPTGNGIVGDDFGAYYAMAHTNSDVFELGPSGGDIIRTKRAGLYLATSWVYLGATFSSYFDLGIGVYGPAAGLLQFWSQQPQHPDSLIRAASWTSGTHPQILRSFSWFRVSGTPTQTIPIDWHGWVENFSGSPNASHNDMTFGLEIVWFGFQTEIPPIYELGAP